MVRDDDARGSGIASRLSATGALLRAVLGAVIASAPAAAQQADGGDRPAGERARRCEALVGPTGTRARAPPDRRHLVVREGRHAIDIYHSDSRLPAPVMVRFDDLVVEDVTQAAPGAAWRAQVRLAGRWEQACRARREVLRAGDSFGNDGRVVGVTARGVLIDLRERLFWLPADPTKGAPVFRLVWVSGFRVSSNAHAAPSPRPTAKRNKRTLAAKRRAALARKRRAALARKRRAHAKKQAQKRAARRRR